MKTNPQLPRGAELLHNPALNKGTAFTEIERDALGLRGLLPPVVESLKTQAQRMIENVRAKGSPFEKYLHLASIQDSNETLFYRVLIDEIEEMMPIVYTPTVGQACQRFSHIYQHSRGLFLTLQDRRHVADILRNCPQKDVRIIVVTDGERILGLGDLGAGGMGIPIGKLALYIACAGIDPTFCLPVTIDVGTENETLLADPLYIGQRRKRERGPEYDALIEEFVNAVNEVYPKVLIQFEDFGNRNAFRLLNTYRDRVCTFNDDIQGTASVALAGILSALRITGGKLRDQRLLFLGAGEAGTGIGELLVSALMREGVSRADACRCCSYVDSKGLVVAGRGNLEHHKQPFAHAMAPETDLLKVIQTIRPTALIGVSGQGGAFTEPMIREMASINARPIIFALSNPTSKAECTAENAYAWTDGRAVFASGSPFAPVTLNGRTHVPGQGNNAYIFPGVGLGIIAVNSSRVTDDMFLAAAEALAGVTTESDLAQGRIYPSLTQIRNVSIVIAAAVARMAVEKGLATDVPAGDIEAHIRSVVYDPVYRPY
jgi:malate dehydrogenase (oxaloacetate-decarboxylating)(NADP+)